MYFMSVLLLIRCIRRSHFLTDAVTGRTRALRQPLPRCISGASRIASIFAGRRYLIYWEKYQHGQRRRCLSCGMTVLPWPDGYCFGGRGLGILRVKVPPKTIVRPSGRALARYSSSYLKKRASPFTGRIKLD